MADQEADEIFGGGEMSKLKACPFCNHSAKIVKQFKASVPVKNEELHYQIKCNYCSAQSGWADDEQFIIDWWNGNYIEDKLQAEIDVLQKRLNVAVHLNEDSAEGFDWAVLDKVFLYDNLKKHVREAVGEIDAVFENPDSQGLFAEGFEHAYFIFKKHGLIEEE